MPLAVDHPWLLGLLILCIPALLGRSDTWHGMSSLASVPRDRASGLLDGSLRILAAGAVSLIVLGLAGLHRTHTTVLRTGTGAHIVLVLDRSLSMDEKFARTGQTGQETKTAAASRLIGELFASRPHDEFGVVAFSTEPIPVMPLTAHREAVAAALAAMRRPALANTEIGGGLARGLAMLSQDGGGAARVLLFVSDGAGVIPEETQDYLRAEAPRRHVHIYYVYLRAGDDPPLQEDMTGRTDSTRPAALDGFFRSLGVPYRGFEADNPDAVAAATRLIGQLESRPSVYAETVPRRDEATFCYMAAALCLCLLLVARLAERDLGDAAVGL
jgi:mxaC protein